VFRQSEIELAPRLLDLVPVVNWFDLREDLALLDAIIFFDMELNNMAGDHLRSNVDDVGFDKGIVRDGPGSPVAPPLKSEVAPQDGKYSDSTPDGPAKPRWFLCDGRRNWRRSWGSRSGIQVRRIGCLDCHGAVSSSCVND
jgi:hypothetical protein